MSFRNLFQKDIDSPKNNNNFSFNLTQGKILDQQENEQPKYRANSQTSQSEFDEYGYDDVEAENDDEIEDDEDKDGINTPITALSADEEKRRKNLQASIRFRIKRKNKLNQLQNQINAENDRIEEFKSKLHKLEIENACLRKMLLGNWDPKNNKTSSENSFTNDSNLLNSTVNNTSSNFELLQMLRNNSNSSNDPGYR